MVKPVNWLAVPNLTPGLKNFGLQFNLRFPNRDGASDGAWGDTAHEQHASGHNPDDTPGAKPEWEDADKVPDIRAIDVDKNLNEPGTDMQMVITHLRFLPKIETVFRYWIYDHLIYSAENKFAPRAYTGASGHEEHAHFSGARSEAADQNTSFDFQLEKVGNVVAVRDLPRKGDTGEEVIHWQFRHNFIRNRFTPPLPTLIVDGDYGPKMAEAVAAFWKAVGTQGTFNGDFIPGWLGLKYDIELAAASAKPVPALNVDEAQIKQLVTEWLRINVQGIQVVGNVSGQVVGKVV